MSDRGAQLVRIGAISTAVWFVLVLVLGLFGGDRGGSSLISLVGIVTPVALVWLAVWFARAIAALRDEADELRRLLSAARPDAARQGAAALPESRLPQQAAATGRASPLPAARPAPATAARAPVAQAQRPAAPSAGPKAPADSRQASLGLDSPSPPELSPYDLVLALNFPNGPDDQEAISSLRKALENPELARLIRAAQDVVTLLAAQGVYMDDMRAETLRPGLWRRYAEGSRGAAVAGLALDADETALDTAARMLRWDEVFRDVAHHFLRHFDRVLSRAAAEFDDEALAALSDTRSGRAFTLMAQVTGMVGERSGAEPAGA